MNGWNICFMNTPVFKFCLSNVPGRSFIHLKIVFPFCRLIYFPEQQSNIQKILFEMLPEANLIIFKFVLH